MKKKTSKQKKTALPKAAASEFDSAHPLSHYAQLVTQANEQSAARAYIDGKFHLEASLLDVLIATMSANARELKRGSVAPHLSFDCSRENFVTLLCGKPYFVYEQLDLPLDEAGNPQDSEFTRRQIKEFDSLDEDELSIALQADHGCTTSRMLRAHAEDVRLLADYYKALLGCFRAGAERALALKSDSVRLWMEAMRLLTPRKINPKRTHELGLEEEDVALAYDTAVRAQADLWIDHELKSLKR